MSIPGWTTLLSGVEYSDPSQSDGAIPIYLGLAQDGSHDLDLAPSPQSLPHCKRRHRKRPRSLFHCVDAETGRRESLGTNDADEAAQILLVKNQAARQPALNPQMAKAFREQDVGLGNAVYGAILPQRPHQVGRQRPERLLQQFQGLALGAGGGRW
jgi:hypothetical protein